MHHALTPFLFATALAAQAASVARFGSGCDFLNQTLTIGNNGLPQLGSTFTITYGGPNVNNQISTQPVLALGLQPTNVPIPPTILVQQPANCTQWIVPDVLFVMPVAASGNFVDQQPLSIPNAPTLVGFTFVAQWFAIVIQCGIIPPCTLDALPTSDALLATVGL